MKLKANASSKVIVVRYRRGPNRILEQIATHIADQSGPKIALNFRARTAGKMPSPGGCASTGYPAGSDGPTFLLRIRRLGRVVAVLDDGREEIRRSCISTEVIGLEQRPQRVFPAYQRAGPGQMP